MQSQPLACGAHEVVVAQLVKQEKAGFIVGDIVGQGSLFNPTPNQHTQVVIRQALFDSIVQPQHLQVNLS